MTFVIQATCVCFLAGEKAEGRELRQNAAESVTLQLYCHVQVAQLDGLAFCSNLHLCGCYFSSTVSILKESG